MALFGGQTSGERSYFGAASTRNKQRSLGQSRSYGSLTVSTMTSQEKFVEHVVTSDDTLQRLSLQYNCTIEKLKRINKLFTNDSLFMRKTIQVPVVQTGDTTHSETPVKDRTASDDGRQPQRGTENIDDLFSRIDNQIKQGKDVVNRLKTSTSLYDMEKQCGNEQAKAKVDEAALVFDNVSFRQRGTTTGGQTKLKNTPDLIESPREEQIFNL